jgi:hypothetical protein
MDEAEQRAMAAAVDALMHKFDDTPFEQTLLSTQPALGRLLVHDRGAQMGLALDQAPALGALTAAETVAFIDVLARDAPLNGARLGRAILGPIAASAPPELDTGTFLDVAGLVSGESELTAGAARALDAPGSSYAVNLLVDSIHESVTEKMPGIANIELSRELLGRRVLFGALFEAALVRVLAEERESQTFVSEMIAKSGNPIADMIAAGDIPIPADAQPWPRDGVCSCGLSLDPFLFCCDGKTKIKIEEVNAVEVGGVMERSCCGETFHGFRCDSCGALFTWHLGQVSSLNGRTAQ